MKDLRIGFIGAGQWMRWYHLPTIRYLGHAEKVVPAVIWNRTRSKAEELAEEFSIENVADSVDDLLVNYKIDGVIIAVSRDTAATMVRSASRAGVPFLVEKPPADDLTEARELARITKVPNLVAFNRVFAPVMLHLKELLPKVRPYHMSCVFARRNRNDPMFVFETGIHALTNGAALFGPGKLVAVSFDRVEDDIVYWRATVCHEISPAAPHGISVDYLFAPWSGRAVERYQLTGPKSTVEVFSRQHYAPDDEERIEVSTAGEQGVHTESWRPGDISELERAGYVGEHRAFFGHIRNPEENVFPDIHSTIELMDMAYRINR
jgi:predicted dehydrogenase